MRQWLILVAHLVVTIIKVVTPAGARSVVAESLILKHQLLILNGFRKKAPKLVVLDCTGPVSDTNRRLISNSSETGSSAHSVS